MTSVKSQSYGVIVMSALLTSKPSDTELPPAKKAKLSQDEKRPSDVVIELTESLTLESCRTLIQKHLAPLIDALPAADSAAIVKAFSAADEADRDRANLLELIDYDGHEVSISGQLRALEQSVRRDWHDGYEEQGEMMEPIADEIQDWLSDLFYVAVEKQAYHREVFKALKLAMKFADKLDNTNARCQSLVYLTSNIPCNFIPFHLGFHFPKCSPIKNISSKINQRMSFIALPTCMGYLDRSSEI